MTLEEIEAFRQWHLARLHECDYPVKTKIELVSARERWLATVKRSAQQRESKP